MNDPSQATSTKLAAMLTSEEHKLLACIHCGLCLEACPTYVHTGDENDGPRGRIYLMRAVEEGRLRIESPSFTRHIDRCLGCRACESACPAGVQYGQLLEAARADIANEGRPRGWTGRLLRLTLRHLWLHPRRLGVTFSAARLLRDSRLPHLLLRTKASRFLPGRLEFALALLDSSAPTPPHSSIHSTTSKHVFQRDAAGHAFKPSGSVILSDAASNSDAPSQTKTRALLFKGCVTEGLF
ncbi:MAG: 4Fe-4S dicluster domain-containing protein, partial [Pyrinomonadaceae bacterium]